MCVLFVAAAAVVVVVVVVVVFLPTYIFIQVIVYKWQGRVLDPSVMVVFVY